jgi:hypothetical protein
LIGARDASRCGDSRKAEAFPPPAIIRVETQRRRFVCPGNFLPREVSQSNCPAAPRGGRHGQFTARPEEEQDVARHAKSTRATRAGEDDLPDLLSADPMTNPYIWWLDQAGELSSETFRFVNRRLEKDLEAAARLMTCGDASEALAVQARFANDLAADYLDEGRKLLEVMAHAPALRAAHPGNRSTH